MRFNENAGMCLMQGGYSVNICCRYLEKSTVSCFILNENEIELILIYTLLGYFSSGALVLERCSTLPLLGEEVEEGERRGPGITEPVDKRPEPAVGTEAPLDLTLAF